MDFLKIIDKQLSLDEALNSISSPNCGALTFFVGITRETSENQKVVGLYYECYEPMALKVMKKLCEEARGKWKVENIVVYHRLGMVPVQESSIIVAASAPHRSESIEAVHYLIDSIKGQVPIWKKEIYDTQTSAWKANEECTWKEK